MKNKIVHLLNQLKLIQSIMKISFLITVLTLIICGMAYGQKKNSKVLYEELTPKEFRVRIAEAPIAYLPLGTIEWHGEHLPLGADGLQSKKFLEILADEVGGIVLPMYFLGPDLSRTVKGKQLYGMDFYSAREHGNPEQQLDGSAYWISDSLFSSMVEATLVQLNRAGFKIVVYHGHGPSTKLIQERSVNWERKFGIKMFNCWSETSEEGYGIMTDHAAMNETSLLMAMRPELVQMENLPSVSSKWPVGVSGKDPRKYASSEVGIKSIDEQKERMGKILRNALSEL
jgi:creatinine amidohydrolase